MSAFHEARVLIERRLEVDQPLIVAIEGGAATGKSTLAAQLSAHFQAPVIPMDDFFLPPALRTPKRYAEKGGNIHYERFDAQVATPLRAGAPVCYQVYDCHHDRISQTRTISPGRLLLIEGVYSLHPRYRDIYDLRLFLRTTAATQDARLRARGDGLYQRFQSTWLPLEKAYFDSEDWPRLCDAILTT
ncbi:MAG: hypothetical protein IJ189_09585 [Clostridia bacterium]|nr:hypothetical protein [Clostridia bacterium]